MEGLDSSLSTYLFYAGVLAFSDGLFALKIPAIASSQRKSLTGTADPPLALASVASILTRWLYCILASTALINKDLQDAGTNYALLGVAVYLTVRYIPEIVSEQGQI